MTEIEHTGPPGKKDSHESPSVDEFDTPRAFLGPLFTLLHPYRRVIGGVLWLSALVAVALGAVAWIIMPVQRTASLEFRIDFDGIQEGKYPNGTKFSTEDLLSEPVLRRVYDENGLEKYAKFDRFRTSLFVTSSNKALELLELEYTGRLADPKLQPVDRQRMEREFREKLASIKGATFFLVLARNERLRLMDRPLMEKVLRGVLEAWAEDTAKIRGALRYELPTYSRSFIQRDLLQSEDYLIGADMLRTKIHHVRVSVEQLLRVPGVQVLRVPGSARSLPEIRDRLEDLKTFQVNPMIGLIRTSGLCKNPASTVHYIENRLFDVRQEETLAQDRERKVKEGFEVYAGSEKRTAVLTGGKAVTEGSAGTGRDMGTAAVIPQLGESFIDRLMQLANRDTDVAFRQDLTERMITSGLTEADAARETAFYKELQTAFKSVRPASDPAGRSAASKEFEERLTSTIDELEKLLDDIQAIYDLVSARNLRPSSFLYTVERPMTVVSTSALSFSRFTAFGGLFVVFAGCAAAAGALFHARLRGTRS
ncbi:MAG: hypothetical protein ACHQPI_10840 [Thermoanaerobaculia bacterium]